jgi:hypothetical protein
VALVSPEDHPRLSRYRWSFDPTTGYARRTLRDRATGRTHPIYVHSLVAGVSDCKGVFVIVDHRDGDRLHCGRHNLRRCSAAENARNRRKPAAKSSRYKGVTYCRRPEGKPPLTRPWRARIKFEMLPLHIGYFATEEEAAHAYNAMARCLYGEYARLNRLDPPPEPGPAPQPKISRSREVVPMRTASSLFRR